MRRNTKVSIWAVAIVGLGYLACRLGGPKVKEFILGESNSKIARLEKDIENTKRELSKVASENKNSKTLRLNKNKTVTKEDPTPYIKNAERHLANLHYYTGKVDGRDTPELHKAIEKFQSDHGLNATGKLTPNTYKAILEADGVKANETAVERPANTLSSVPVASTAQAPASQPAAVAALAVISGLNINAPSLRKDFCEGDVVNTAGDRVLLVDVRGKKRDDVTLRFPDGKTVRVDVKKDGSVSFRNKDDKGSLSAEQKAAVKGAAVSAENDCGSAWVQKQNGEKTATKNQKLSAKAGQDVQIGQYTVHLGAAFQAEAPFYEFYPYYDPVWGGGAGRPLFTIGGGYRGHAPTHGSGRR